MDDRVVEDDAYSDDDLDALPANAFQKLQADAILSTQELADKRYGFLREIPFSRSHQAEKARGYGHQPALSIGPDRRTDLQPPSSDYGDFEDEMLDGEIVDGAVHGAVPIQFNPTDTNYVPGESTQREQWRQQRYGAASIATSGMPHRAAEHHPSGSPKAVDDAPQGLVQDHAQKVAGKSTQNVKDEENAESYQRQIRILQNQCEALRRASKDAKQEVFSKSGEIAIVRAKADRLEKESEVRTKSLQKLHADETTRQRLELERTKAELRKLVTEKGFLENELADTVKQTRQLQLASKKGNAHEQSSVVARRSSPLSTPRKNSSAYADGFDDNEVQPMSPSALALRGKGGTPKAGSKRKRKINDPSPVKPLQLAQSPRKEASKTSTQEELNTGRPTVYHVSKPSDAQFGLIQKLLNHRILPGRERTIEALTSFKMPSEEPSEQGKALSTLFYDRLSLLGTGPAENLPVSISMIVISIWSRCMQEFYHGPVHLIVDLLKYILILNPLKIAPELTNSLMMLVQETADIVIIPRCQKKPPRDDIAQISSFDCLQIMQLMAQDCSIEAEENTRFWRTVRFDFIMMLLSFVHPVEEISTAISMLQTSVLETSFAMIIPPGDGRQDASEARVIDNLSRLLVDSPRPAYGEQSLDAVQLSGLRLEVLSLMAHMCDSTYGSEALAKHRLVVGRLVRVMNDELDRAYDRQYGHEERVLLVNESTRLLYLLTSNHPDLINMQSRLSLIPGGEKKYIIALTRLAFCEGGYLESGIEDDVVEKAHHMLEMRVSPEEAEQLVEAFASAQSIRKDGREGS